MKYSFKRLQKWAILGIFVVLVFSCKSTSVIKSGTVDENLTAKAVIRNHYYSHINFKTLSGKMRIDYS
ncbi:MAG: DUF4292 domain-containing protein, partial [Arenibacter sp.]